MSERATTRETPMAHGTLNACFGCGDDNHAGLHLQFFVDDEQRVLCRVHLARQFQGPPGHAHGGIIATLLDEAMSKAVRAQGSTSMTRKIEIDYLRPVPSGAQLRIEGRVVRNEPRKHWSEARILNEDGTVLAEAKGLFIEVRTSPKS